MANKTLRLYLPTKNIDQMTSLIPLLGQAGLNAATFKKKYLNLLKQFNLNCFIIVPVHVKIISAQEIVLKLFDPTISFLIKICSNESNQISLINIYKIAVLRNRSLINLKPIIKSIISTVFSMKIIIN